MLFTGLSKIYDQELCLINTVGETGTQKINSYTKHTHTIQLKINETAKHT